ncbi:MAG: sorbosone dehydrogenase family protein [Acidobacteriota bacterium]
MKHLRWVPLCASTLLAAAVLLQAAKVDTWTILTGDAAWANSSKLVPGTARRITAKSLPSPTKATPGKQKQIPRPAGAMPKAPEGFTVNIFAETGTNAPRQIRVAPNGDIFVVNETQNNITVYRGIGPDGKAVSSQTFTEGLNGPFGVNFYPAGKDPKWVYVGNTNGVVRFPYKSGDMKATGPSEALITDIPGGGNHRTRDIVFSKDGKSLLVAVGSNSNIDDPDKAKTEFHRANILEYTPEGKFVGIYASGIRNPVGLEVNPTTGEVWTSINERDNLGDNLVPDYVTSVKKGGFYGWPYYYIGGILDERLGEPHPELKAKTILPDVLIQPHSASLGMTFYTGDKFPAEYRGDAFAAEHGSWNRSVKAGHEVIRIPLEKGKASGVYQDFLTGFVDENEQPWGRPSGVATAPDGSLLVTDDGARIIWRVAYTGKK